MPLDVEELPESSLFVPVRSPPPPLSPRSTSLVPSTPSSPRDRTPTPEPAVRPGDTYASRDEAVSQFSVLNKRPEKVPGILSKSSALNSRYHMVNDVPPVKKPQGPQGVPVGAGRAPPANGLAPGRAAAAAGGRQNGAASANGEDMDAWLESVFHGVVNEGVGDLRNSNALGRRLKGGGDDLPSQVTTTKHIFAKHRLLVVSSIVMSTFL